MIPKLKPFLINYWLSEVFNRLHHISNQTFCYIKSLPWLRRLCLRFGCNRRDLTATPTSLKHPQHHRLLQTFGSLFRPLADQRTRSKWNSWLTVSGEPESQTLETSMTLPFWSLKNDKNRMNLQSKIFFLIRKYPWKNNLGLQKICHVQGEIVDGDASFYNALQ